MQLITNSDTEVNYKFEEYYKKFYPLILNICTRYSNNPMDAMDLAHDVFIKCYEKFPDFREESKISTWMYRVAVNSGIDHTRKKKMDNYKPKDPENFTLTRDEFPENKILNKITFEKLFSQFDRKTKEILFLYYVENLNQVEISELRGVSRQAVKKHLNKFAQYYEKFDGNLIRNAI